MKLIKAILRITLLVPVLSVSAWHFATPDQRAHYLPWVHQVAKTLSGGRAPEYFQLLIECISVRSILAGKFIKAALAVGFLFG